MCAILCCIEILPERELILRLIHALRENASALSSQLSL